VYNIVIADELAPRLAAAARGDEEACAWLYHVYSSRVLRLALGLLGEVADAEEVAQDTFVYAFRRLGRFNPDKSSFSTWLCTIAVSRCRNKRRRKWLASIPLHLLREGEQPLVGGDGGRHIEKVLEAHGVRRQVWQAVLGLPPQLSEAVALRFFGELSYAEMGQVLGINPKTAESRVRLGLQALRRRLVEAELQFEPV
jgi:RNA polymerase sigma-70 factor (ECF subfamily)